MEKSRVIREERGLKLYNDEWIEFEVYVIYPMNEDKEFINIYKSEKIANNKANKLINEGKLAIVKPIRCSKYKHA